MAIMLKDRLSDKVDSTTKLNSQMDTTNADATVLLNLINYMEIEESDTKITLDKKLNARKLAPKPVKHNKKQCT